MNEWKEYKLGELIDSISETYKFSDEKVVFLNTSDIYDGMILSHILYDPKTLPGQAKKRIQKGDLLYSEIRPANKRYAIVDIDAERYVVSTKLMVLRNKGLINNDYLRLYLTSSDMLEYLQMIAEDRSGTFPQITFDNIASLNIILPPMKEQEQIAGILSSLDDKINLLNRQNATLEAMAETLFRQYFIENSNPNWKEGILGDIAEIFAGGDKPKIVQNESTDECNIPIYSNGITNEGLYGYTNSAKVMEESVTISARGTIGFVCLRRTPYVPIVRLISLIPKKEVISSIYLYLLLKQDNISGTGTTQQQLTVPDFSNHSIIIPTYDTVKDFTNDTTQLFDKITFNKIQINTLIKLRRTLLPKLMNNEIKICQ